MDHFGHPPPPNQFGTWLLWVFQLKCASSIWRCPAELAETRLARANPRRMRCWRSSPRGKIPNCHCTSTSAGSRWRQRCLSAATWSRPDSYPINKQTLWLRDTVVNFSVWTYLKREGHSASDLTVHLSLLEDLIVLVRARLPYVDDSPRETVLQALDSLEVDVEGYRIDERCFRLLHYHVQYVYQWHDSMIYFCKIFLIIWIHRHCG